MAVQCAECGEELLGSVNRCWRCGHELVSRAGSAELPPLRRAPISDLLDGALAAEVIDVLENSESDQAIEPEQRWSRRGSPFAKPGSDSSLPDINVDTVPRLPEYPRNAGAIGGTVVAIGLGVIGFGLAFVFPVGALIVSLLGLVMGIWGVYSKRRSAAIVGLLICCVAFATAGFNGAVELYTYVHGVSPFETYVPVTVQE